jgi:PAS domain S-box-containing protein
MLNNPSRMIHVAALGQIMHTLTQEARTTLSNATPQPEAVKRLEEAVRVHPYAVLFSDNTGRYVGANLAAIELTGYSRRELLAASVFDITPSTDERETELLWRAFLRIGRQDGEITIRRRDGSHISSRYLASTNVVPGVHVSVLAKI